MKNILLKSKSNLRSSRWAASVGLPLLISILTLATLTSLLNPTASLAASVKADPLAVRGCLTKVSVEAAKSIVDRYNYKLIGATSMETRAIGTALTYIERLNGGETFSPAVAREGYGVRFREKKGHSAQRSGEIAINRNGDLKYGENVAQLVHEIAHLIGNNGVYEEYRTALGHSRRRPKYCKVSGYSTSRANEQFAEAFAAFATRPELIKDSRDPNCKKAWAFFKKKFPKAELADKCYVAQNAAEVKLGGIADGVPSEAGAQTKESKENGVRASQADDASEKSAKTANDEKSEKAPTPKKDSKPVARTVYKPKAKRTSTTTASAPKKSAPIAPQAPEVKKEKSAPPKPKPTATPKPPQPPPKASPSPTPIPAPTPEDITPSRMPEDLLPQPKKSGTKTT